MIKFEYTSESLRELERTLSHDRLTPYLASMGGDAERAIRLYEQNMTLSEALYGVLQGLEVALRNAVHDQLTAGTGTVSWWKSIPLASEQQELIHYAEEALRRDGKPPDAGRIVAELSFGFWTSLFGVRYSRIWRDHLVKAFPRRRLQRAEVHTRLTLIRKLRNRVAHHEPILSRPLQKSVNDIFDTLSWMSPVTARWVQSNSSFESRYKTYQSLFPAVPMGKFVGKLHFAGDERK